MIFITVGTQLPFDRLVEAVDAWAQIHPEAEVFGQIAEPGKHGYRPQHFTWVPYLDPVEFKTKFDSADLIVAHAGMGTIISALTAGKPLMVMPRRAHLSEHRNDHQWATVNSLGERANLLLASDEREVPALLDKYAGMRSNERGSVIDPHADQRLIDSLRELILR